MKAFWKILAYPAQLLCLSAFSVEIDNFFLQKVLSYELFYLFILFF